MKFQTGCKNKAKDIMQLSHLAVPYFTISCDEPKRLCKICLLKSRFYQVIYQKTWDVVEQLLENPAANRFENEFH